VLDADKAGFLRSRSSLIQVSGRAARNIHGKVILYGDNITDAIQYLLDETKRRKKIQSEYNKKHKIEPQTIYKSMEDIRLSTAVADENSQSSKGEGVEIDVSTFDGIETRASLDELQRKMLQYARDLQFEQAAILRDKIKVIEESIQIDL
jgi:excinuclease ABC subunit B